jgi:hypothetical protein
MALEGWIHFFKPWIQSFRSISNQRYDFCKIWMFCIFYSWFLSAFFRRNILKDLILIGFEGSNPFLKAWIQFYRGYDVSGAPRVQCFEFLILRIFMWQWSQKRHIFGRMTTWIESLWWFESIFRRSDSNLWLIEPHSSFSFLIRAVVWNRFKFLFRRSDSELWRIEQHVFKHSSVTILPIDVFD